MEDIIITRHIVPCGELVIGSTEGRLCLCDWVNGWHSAQTSERIKKYKRSRFTVGTADVNIMTARQLDEYFCGQRRAFDVPLMLLGTDFQKHVWEELRNIPYGTTVSYAEQARRLCVPKAIRAVANANGANPISIILPCHRVIGSNSSLTGYGGGLEVKKFLIELEKNEEDIYGCARKEIYKEKERDERR